MVLLHGDPSGNASRDEPEVVPLAANEVEVATEPEEGESSSSSSSATDNCPLNWNIFSLPNFSSRDARAEQALIEWTEREIESLINGYYEGESLTL